MQCGTEYILERRREERREREGERERRGREREREDEVQVVMLGFFNARMYHSLKVAELLDRAPDCLCREEQSSQS